ncbi:MAG TPA: sialidase family protein [Pyrinomonadaceae bacterium]|nr:sialidase family protein [Pyrinomonadaceae bacterium]
MPEFYGFRPVQAEFDLGNTGRIEFKHFRLETDGQHRLLIGYEKYDRSQGKNLGAFLRISTDGGTSFGPERMMPVSILSKFFLAFTKGGLAAVYASSPDARQNIFYTRLEDNNSATWSTPVQINDEQGSAGMGGAGEVVFVQPSENDVYCLWTDDRRGFTLIFFSASQDGGRSWTPNQPVEYDFREGVQLRPRLVAGATGRLLAFWQDARDRQSLFDIRCSYSDDRGQHWSASQKINDDHEHVWQSDPRVVAKGNQIYAVFTDFREPGEGGYNDWNIYFTASPDNGQTWKRNTRVNDLQAGVDDWPLIAIDERNTLYCAWRSSRASIFGEVYCAYSTDGGESWSHALKLNEGDEFWYRLPYDLVALAGGKLLCRWAENRPGLKKTHLTWLEPLSAPAMVDEPAPAPESSPHVATSFPDGKVLLADDFSSSNPARWEVATGTWIVIDGALMGVEPGKLAPYTSFMRLKEPERYLLRGRFKLDPVHHQMAYLYFRASTTPDRAYIIGNGFGTGVSLSFKEDDSPPLWFGPFALVGRPLAQHRFPFQNNRWYEFALIVTPERVEYYVDGRWMLSYEGRLELLPGSIGIGGFGLAPTYFDDIVVSLK